jgi:hypothetical protein
MSFSPGRSHPSAPDTPPIDRHRQTAHDPDCSHAGQSPVDHPQAEHCSHADHWPRRSPRDSAAILLSQAVARISDAELQRMDRSDLIQVAHFASCVLPQQRYLRHLPYMSREQLQQLACLARRSCRLQQRAGVSLD